MTLSISAERNDDGTYTGRLLDHDGVVLITCPPAATERLALRGADAYRRARENLEAQRRGETRGGYYVTPSDRHAMRGGWSG